jgi:hypothetical protein
VTHTSVRAGVAVLAIAGALSMAGGAWSDKPGPYTIEHAAPAQKRVAPPDVLPVTVGTLRIEALPWGRERGLGQNGGYVAAIDPATGAELWTLKIYDVPYDGVMEEDVQDVFIASMRALGEGRVEIVDEDGRRYVLDIAARRVTRP